MWTKRIKELIAISVIGDGVLTLIAPSKHYLLWLVGPEGVRNLVVWFAEGSSIFMKRLKVVRLTVPA